MNPKDILNDLEPGRLSQVKGRRQLTHDCRSFGEVLAKIDEPKREVLVLSVAGPIFAITPA